MSDESLTPDRVVTSATTVRTRECENCFHVLPLSEFRVRLDEQVDVLRFAHVCHSCRDTIHEIAERQKRERKRDRAREAKREEEIRKLRTALNPDALVAPSLEELASESMRQFGGIEEFVRLVQEQTLAAFTTQKGSANACRWANLVSGWLVSNAEDKTSKSKAIENMSDAELEAFIETHVEARSVLMLEEAGINPEQARLLIDAAQAGTIQIAGITPDGDNSASGGESDGAA